MNDAPLRDEEARNAIATDLDSTILVEAGAGSGKTASLVRRMVALVATGRCTVDRMAAVTFTRKAASELRQRFQIALESTAEATHAPAVEQALLDLDRCFIGTIHSFCGRLLREKPVETGVDPSFREIEGTLESHLRTWSWEEYLDEAAAGDGGALRELERLGVTIDDLRQVYERITLFPDAEIVRRPAPAPDFAAIRKSLDEFLRWAGRRLPPSPPDGPDQAQSVIRRCIRLAATTDLGEPKNLFRVIEMLDHDLAVVQRRWGSKADAIEFREHLQRFRDEVAAPALRAWREHRHYPLIEFVLPAAKKFEEKRRASAMLNFQDLLMLTSRMLRDNPQVRRYFQHRISRLLVDEFQDTDPVQAEVMFYLTGSDVEQRDWTMISPLPGSLFVVGDPKQSIYRFRRADIDVYNTVKRLVRSSGGRVLTLTSSFRSVEPVARWVNTVFRAVFPAEPTPYQASFAGMDAVRDPLPGAFSGVFRTTVPSVSGSNALAIASIDAERIALWLKWALAGNVLVSKNGPAPLLPGDVLIITMRRRHLSIYARALEKYGIPFEMSGGEAFASSADVREFLKVMRCISDPDNPVPLVAALRGRYFGVSDRQLQEYRCAGGSFSLLANVPDFDGAASGATLGAALAAACIRTLASSHRVSTQVPPSALMDAVASELGALALAASGGMGASRAGNMLKLLEMARQAEARGYASLRDVVSFLDMAVEGGEVDEMSAFPAREGAVRLMNLHKAKGLEAPVVFLADPSAERPHEPSEHVTRTGGTGAAYFAVCSQRGPWARQVIAAPVGWDDLKEKELLFQQAERQRLLYVAATRAREALVISDYAGKPEANPWRLLLEGGDIPELEPSPDEIAGMVQGAPADERDAPEPGDLVEAERRRMEAVERVLVPSYSRIAVTDIDHDQEPGDLWPRPAGPTPPPGAVTGEKPAPWGGAVAGTVVHRVLRMVAEDEAVEDIVESLVCREAVESGCDRSVAAVLADVVKPVLRLQLWRRMRSADRRLFEVPFAAAGGAGSAPEVTTGVIDLVFHEPDGWVLVDYKTDYGVDDSEILGRYSGQVAAYARLWEGLTGESVKEACIVRCTPGEARILPCSRLAGQRAGTVV